MPASKPLIILGIDPGVATTGYGLIKKEGSSVSLITCGVIKTAPELPFPERLEIIHEKLTGIIKAYKPGLLAVEELFFFKNVKTVMTVGQVRGVIILTAILNHLPIQEYTPLEVKQATTGYGRADKNQVQSMVKLILRMASVPKPDDAADALACAICASQSLNLKIKS